MAIDVLCRPVGSPRTSLEGDCNWGVSAEKVARKTLCLEVASAPGSSTTNYIMRSSLEKLLMLKSSRRPISRFRVVVGYCMGFMIKNSKVPNDLAPSLAFAPGSECCISVHGVFPPASSSHFCFSIQVLGVCLLSCLLPCACSLCVPLQTEPGTLSCITLITAVEFPVCFLCLSHMSHVCFLCTV